MLGSSGTCPRCDFYPMCPYRISLGGEATPSELLLAEVLLPAPSMLVQRSLQTLSKHPGAGQRGHPGAWCSFCRAWLTRHPLSQALSALGGLQNKACDSSAQPTLEPVF